MQGLSGHSIAKPHFLGINCKLVLYDAYQGESAPTEQVPNLRTKVRLAGPPEVLVAWPEKWKISFYTRGILWLY